MSILPELILQQVLVRGIKSFREENYLIDTLFTTVSHQERQAIRSFLRDNSVEICINYPDQDLKVPSIVILMKGESESQAFVGGLQMGAGDFWNMGIVPFPEDELLGDATIPGRGSISPVGAPPELLLRPTTALDGTSTTIVASSSITSLIDPYETEAWVEILEGIAAGDRRLVTSIVPNSTNSEVIITVATAFSTAPDDTSIFKLVGPYPEIGTTGSKEKVFNSQDAVDREGSIFRAVYQLDIAGTSPEAAIYLYTIVKAIVYVAKSLLLKQGFLTLAKMSGADLAPAAEYAPTLVYRRSLTLEFEYAFDVYKDITETLANHIELDLGVHAPNVSEYNDDEVEVLSTTLDL
jgi:hypothetical protein